MDKEQLIKALKEERNDYHPGYNYDIRLGFEGAIEMVEELLESTEAEPLVIPQFVAVFIEKRKSECLTMSEWFDFNCDDEEQHKVFKWLYDNDYEENTIREHLLINAARYGYEVEKEKLYVVELINNNLMSCLAYDLVDKVFFISQTQEERLNKFKKRFTEQEIKDYDERFWPFAVEVTE